MQTRRLGDGGPQVGAIAFGAMSFAGYYGSAEDAEGVRAVHRALDLGITLIDTAEIYGDRRNEDMVGRALRDRRDRAVLATKASRGAPGYLAEHARASLRRLRTDHIDLYYLHRVDADVPIEESVGAMARLVEQGTVRHIGLSEAGPETIRRAHATHPVTALQSEYSLLSREPERDILPVTRELGIAYVAYSPLSRGLLGGRIRSADDLDPQDWRRQVPRFQGENLERNLAVVSGLAEMAERKGVAVASLALAWILAQGDDLIPLVGTSRADRLDANLEALEVDLTPDDLTAIADLAPVGVASGARYPEAYMPRLGI